MDTVTRFAPSPTGLLHLGHAHSALTGWRAARESGEIDVAIDEELSRYVVEKGSIALDGVSLTVAAVDTSTVTVALIPATRESTTLGEAAVGALLNVEVDIMAKHLERLVSR